MSQYYGISNSHRSASRIVSLLVFFVLMATPAKPGDDPRPSETTSESSTAAPLPALLVTKLNDTNDGSCDADCSLREALEAASPNSTINFAPKLDGKIKLGSTLIIDKNVIINGSSTKAITISGDDKVRVFYVNSGIEFRVINLTIAYGRVRGEPGSSGKPGQPGGAGAAAKGGGLYNDGGTVTILNCTFLDNKAMGGSGGRGGFGGVGGVKPDSLPVPARMGGMGGKKTYPGPGGKGGDGMGGGLYNAGTVSLVNSTFSGNTAMGGRGGDVGLDTRPLPTDWPQWSSPVIIGGDGGDGYGGAIYSTADIWISSCTLSDNGASAGSGGFDRENSYNRSGAPGTGSGAALYRPGALPTGSTLALNRSRTPVVKNTLIVNSSSGDNCGGEIESGGNNIDSDGTCSLKAAGDLSKINPKLGSLKNNGGSTFTHALRPDSPAIDGGNPAGCTDHKGAAILTDQRGLSRPWGERCDIGAFEFSR